jgi:hypothetical protein
MYEFEHAAGVISNGAMHVQSRGITVVENDDEEEKSVGIGQGEFEGGCRSSHCSITGG